MCLPLKVNAANDIWKYVSYKCSKWRRKNTNMDTKTNTNTLNYAYDNAANDIWRYIQGPLQIAKLWKLDDSSWTLTKETCEVLMMTFLTFWEEQPQQPYWPSDKLWHCTCHLGNLKIRFKNKCCWKIGWYHQLNSSGAFWALPGRFGNSWSCQEPPNHLLHKTNF